MPSTISTIRSRPQVRRSLPSVMMRSGTSKGLFIHRQHMPTYENEWGPVLLSAMGSRNGDRKQIDGVGGATSTTSKVAIISKSARRDADVDYTFVQVAVGQEKVDFTGNCGNMASGVGPFALDEGLVHAMPGQTELDIRVYNTNTDRIIVETVQVDSEGNFYELGDCKIGGVQSTGSEIKVRFMEPAGSMTGVLLPTGNKTDVLHVTNPSNFKPLSIVATLMDAANPFIFVDASSLPKSFHAAGTSAASSIELIEAVRRVGAVKMGLARDIESAALVRGTPKIAVLSPSVPESNGKRADINVTSYSMGKLHPTLQLTGAVCLGSALCVEGTVAQEVSERGLLLTPAGTPRSDSEEDGHSSKKMERTVRIRHGGGDIEAVVSVRHLEGREVGIESVGVSRTARRLFKGEVLFTL